MVLHLLNIPLEADNVNRLIEKTKVAGRTELVALTKGQALTGQSAALNQETIYYIDVPANSTNISIDITGGSGDADLYVREGSQSTTSAYDCRPYKNGNNEVCTFSSPASGTWHIDLRGYSAASGVTLRVQAD